MGNNSASTNGTTLPRVCRRAAKLARLRYVSSDGPGISRVPRRGGFAYISTRGQRIRSVPLIERIRRLAIPPAWSDVWICPDPRGHLQATGRDARGRKQHRYHPRWRETRDASKFDRMVAFGEALPRLRKQVRKDLRDPLLSREKVLALVISLLEATLIRVGNEEYSRLNGSYGLTTLRERHVKTRSSSIRFYFRGKGGATHRIALRNRRLARIMRRFQDLPGQELFQYVDETGRLHKISSHDVNEYLRTVMGEDFTAKDFRTWAATMLAAFALQKSGPFFSQREAKHKVNEAISQVAERLGNTVAICRKCYVHPALIELYLKGELALELPDLHTKNGDSSTAWNRRDERAVLNFLRRL